VPSIPATRCLRRSAVVAAVAAAALALAACSSSSSSTPASSSAPASPAAAKKPMNIAYLSFAVQNSYDAPMLAAAQTAAADSGAKLTVFDANNSPQTQQQLQDVINSGQYNGIILQPIYGAGLTSIVATAIGKGIKVVNMDQILGSNLSTDQPQVQGLSAARCYHRG
jgi:ribose transport system substrate-binding protein